MAIQVAETNKTKKSKKVLAHVEIHPKLDGGLLVRHVYHGFGHEAQDHHFNKDGYSQGGQHVVAHLQRHAGLPDFQKQEASKTEEEFEA